MELVFALSCRVVRYGTLSLACALSLTASSARADTSPPRAPASQPSYATAVFVERGVAFVPFAIDVPLMAGGGVRFAKVHELWARGGYIPTGDDTGLGFGVGGYRIVLRPDKIVRPTFGLLFAGLPETCTHDAARRPLCTDHPLFIGAATFGVRFEPTRWLGISSVLTLGSDSYPNSFGMMEVVASFALPLD